MIAVGNPPTAEPATEASAQPRTEKLDSGLIGRLRL